MTALLLFAPSALLAEDPANTEAASPDAKFAFSLEDLGDGSRPDAAGVPRPIGYEYCIPKSPEGIMMVANTDPTGKVHTDRSTTIKCTDDELSVSGHTGQLDYLNVLRKIAGNDFVKKIILVDPQ